MLSRNLRTAREARHWSRRELADRSGVHPNTIADIEAERNRNPAFDKVVLLARALEMDPETLWPVASREVA